jgi:hypothetical protein
MTVIDLVLYEDNAPVANSKPATFRALEAPYISRSVGCIDRQFGIYALPDIHREFKPHCKTIWASAVKAVPNEDTTYVSSPKLLLRIILGLIYP